MATDHAAPAVPALMGVSGGSSKPSRNHIHGQMISVGRVTPALMLRYRRRSIEAREAANQTEEVTVDGLTFLQDFWILSAKPVCMPG